MTAPGEVLQLAERGARVFPLAPLSKKPPAGFVDWETEHNSSDLHQINEWAKEYPDCNWAMLCGSASRRFELDFDCKNGARGLDQYSRWTEEYGDEWTRTPRVSTASGGLHVGFRWEPGIGKDNRGKLASGVDVQGAGSYVAIPPSKLENGVYRFEYGGPESPWATPPEWLRQKLQKVFPQEKPQPTETEIPSGKVPAGQRHAVLLSQAGKMLAHGIDFDALYAHLLWVNRKRFETPYSEAEISRQARDLFDRYAVPQKTIILGPEVEELETKLTTAEVSINEAPETVEYLVEHLIPVGASFILTAKVKTGKTTLLLDLFRALLDGGTWCGLATQQTSIIYLTEQGRTSFTEQLRNAGVCSSNLHILYFNEVRKHPWKAIARKMVEMAGRLGAKLIVVDTFTKWAEIEKEQDQSAAMFMNELLAAQALGIAPGFVFHSRKNDETEVEDSVAGTRAFAGNVDIIFQLKRPRGNDRSGSHRILNYQGRFQDIPERLGLELVDNRYVIRGDGSAMGFEKAVWDIKKVIPTSPDQAMTLSKLMAVGGGLSRSTAMRALRKLDAQRIDGNRQAPDKFFLNPEGSDVQPRIYKKSILNNATKTPPITPQGAGRATLEGVVVTPLDGKGLKNTAIPGEQKPVAAQKTLNNVFEQREPDQKPEPKSWEDLPE